MKATPMNLYLVSEDQLKNLETMTGAVVFLDSGESEIFKQLLAAIRSHPLPESAYRELAEAEPGQFPDA
jgi:hypothetical protein